MTEREAQGLVLVPNVLNGSVAVVKATEARPSQRSLDLADALEGLATYDGGGLWDPSPDARQAKWLGDVELALEQHAITTKEWAALLETFGRLGRAGGWFGADGERELQALLRMRLGPGGRG